MKKLFRCLSFLLAIAIAAGLTGCGKQEFVFANESTSCGNAVMGMGRFAARNGFIYFSGNSSLYEYDTETDQTAALIDGKHTYVDLHSLFVTDDFVGYTNSHSGLSYITKDGKKTGTLLPSDGRLWYLFVDGDFAYHTANGLTRQNLQTGKSELLIEEEVLSYFVDKNYIYAAMLKQIPAEGSDAEDEEDGAARAVYSLLRSSKETVAFEEVPLTCNPIRVYACEEGLFLSNAGSWQIIHCSDGQETTLPIYSIYYQVLDGHVIYCDEKESRGSVCPVKSYDLATGEIELICENVFNFCILSDRYICFYTWEPDGSERWVLYDWNTGTSVTMHQATPTLYIHG